MLKRTLVVAAVVAVLGCNARGNDSNPPAGDDSRPAAELGTAPAGAVEPVSDHNAASRNDKAATGGAASPSHASKPEYREVRLAAGTEIPITLETAIASDTSRIEQPVRARVRRAVVVNGVDAVPEGSTLSGAVTEARRSGRVQGRARVAFRLTLLHPANTGERVEVRTALVGRTAPATKKKDAEKIAIPAGVGAIVGGVIGGGSGAAKGAVIGGSAGTGYVLATRGAEVHLPVGTALTVKLAEPVTLRVPVRK